MMINSLPELHLTELHECNALAGRYLIPPHEGGEVELAGGDKARFVPIYYWCIVSWPTGQALHIEYCPFCGQYLPLPNDADEMDDIDWNRIGENS